MANIVTIAVYANHFDAIVVKKHLLEQGIDSFIDDTVASANKLGGENAGNIKLNVKLEDASKATDLIKDMQISYEAEEENIFEDDEEDKKWKEEMQLQEMKNAQGGKWGFVIAGIIGLAAILWFLVKK
jgi:hypothetical protein